MKIDDFLLKRYLRSEDDFTVLLGEIHQPGALYVRVEASVLWKEESLKRKIIALLQKKWNPEEKKMRSIAKEYFMKEVFGGEDDLGETLFTLIAWHNSQKWDLSSLTTADIERAKALEGMTILTDMRFVKKAYSALPLHLAVRAPGMCLLIYPMIVKVPIVSMRTYLKIDYAFTFNAIRHSKHPCADELVAFLYEIMIMQHKIANSLHELVLLTVYTRENKKDALLINAEVDAIREVDSIITNLKAVIEKSVAFIGLIYEIKNLDSKKDHQKRVNALLAGIPEKTLKLYYWEFIFEFIKSETLEELNNFRTGILHKKGIAELQPHNYMGNTESHSHLTKMFKFLHEQHSKNTGVLIGMLSLLTDDLVTRDPPSLSMEELMVSITNFSDHLKPD